MGIKEHDYKLQKDEDYSLIMMSPSGKTSFRIRIPKKWFVASIAGVMVLVIGVIVGTTYMSQKTLNRSELVQLKKKTIKQEKKLSRQEDDVKALKSKMETILDREVEMYNMLGGDRRKKRRRRRRKSKSAKLFRNEFRKVERKQAEAPNKVAALIQLLKDRTIQVESGVLKLSRKLEQYRARFASTPSLWPVYGRIKSGYGMRVHPITGRLQKHRGIDVPSWRGAPVVSTADGVVMFSGWGGGYGWVVTVWHGYGYKTIYAHLSEILTIRGHMVKKGEIIGKIGDTGSTTGPHIHYEIRRWEEPVRPNRYLGLDLFTAINTIW